MFMQFKFFAPSGTVNHELVLDDDDDDEGDDKHNKSKLRQTAYTRKACNK